MRRMNRIVVATFLMIGVLALGGTAFAGNGANHSGPYDPTPSAGDNQGNGNAPDNGTVGNADDKNPPGQEPGGSDHNNGYECDGNHGVGDNGGNPAHTGCDSSTPTTTVQHGTTTTTVVHHGTTTTTAPTGVSPTTAPRSDVLGVTITTEDNGTPASATPVSGNALARTGSPTGALAVFALVLLALGGTLVLGSRRYQS